MKRTLASIALATALLLATTGSASAGHYDGLLAPTTKCGGQTATGLSPSDLERTMLCMHNFARAKAGRSALRSDSRLRASSDAKSYDILRCGAFSHNACGRSTLFQVHRVGYTSGRCWGAGENISWGRGSYASVRSRMSGWLHSDGHRNNILSRKYRDLGLGLRKGTYHGNPGSHVWTAHFGYRC